MGVDLPALPKAKDNSGSLSVALVLIWWRLTDPEEEFVSTLEPTSEGEELVGSSLVEEYAVTVSYRDSEPVLYEPSEDIDKR